MNAIGWDTPIVDKLPWFALSDPVVTQMVTVGDMYSHRSGLPDHAGDCSRISAMTGATCWTACVQLPLDPFRISYAYTNFGSDRRGRGGRRRARESRGRTSATKCCSSRSAWRRPVLGSPTTMARPNRAVGHIHVDGRYEPLYVRDAATARRPRAASVRSVNDMTHWLAMMLANGSYEGKQIVDPKALLPAVTPQIVSSPATEPAMRSGFYGFGFNVGSTSAARMQLSHSGAFELGSGTNFVILPSATWPSSRSPTRHPPGCRSAQRSSSPTSSSSARSVRTGTSSTRASWRRWRIRSVRSSATAARQSAPPRPLASYVGTYNNDYWGPARVTEKDGKLQLAIGPKLIVPLNHWDGRRVHVSAGSPRTRRPASVRRPRSTATS